MELELFVVAIVLLSILVLNYVVVSIMRRLDYNRHMQEVEAYECLEVGVDDAWDRFGRTWKGQRLDGKLSEEERRRLNGVALSTADKVADDKGIDVVNILGRKCLPLLIRKIVEARKSS